MEIEDMRSLTINTTLEELKKVKGWIYEKRNMQDMDFNVFKSTTENIEIIIKEESGNNLQTTNILTQDPLDIKPKLKDDQIMKLANSLEKENIGYSINVSDADIKELLSK